MRVHFAELSVQGHIENQCSVYLFPFTHLEVKMIMFRCRYILNLIRREIEAVLSIVHLERIDKSLVCRYGKICRILEISERRMVNLLRVRGESQHILSCLHFKFICLEHGFELLVFREMHTELDLLHPAGYVHFRRSFCKHIDRIRALPVRHIETGLRLSVDCCDSILVHQQFYRTGHGPMVFCSEIQITFRIHDIQPVDDFIIFSPGLDSDISRNLLSHSNCKITVLFLRLSFFLKTRNAENGSDHHTI